MAPRRITRNETGPRRPMSFTMPEIEVPQLDEAVARRGLTRASFMYQAVKNEMRRAMQQPAHSKQLATAS